MTRRAYDERVKEIRAEYDKVKTFPPDPWALTAMSKAFKELGPLPPKDVTPPKETS